VKRPDDVVERKAIGFVSFPRIFSRSKSSKRVVKEHRFVAGADVKRLGAVLNAGNRLTSAPAIFGKARKAGGTT
jgi:hypothetical protein